MIVFATNNQHKLLEVKHLAGDRLDIIGLKDIGFSGDIPENEPTIEGNALSKARYVKEHFGKDCFADDTGLEVSSLDFEPGVHSARYAGPQCDSGDNIRKLLFNLEGKEDRRARFRTVIALILDDKEYLFEGIVEGMIIHEKRGEGGFGYDPVFLPDGFDKTFAELPLDIKNEISHRGRATRKLISFLQHPR